MIGCADAFVGFLAADQVTALDAHRFTVEVHRTGRIGRHAVADFHQRSERELGLDRSTRRGLAVPVGGLRVIGCLIDALLV